MAHFLMTNDVECFSFEHNRYEPSVAKRVLEQGLPRLLDKLKADGTIREPAHKFIK